MKAQGSQPDFFNGLVFGFDVGTGSIGYAVRRGSEFLDVGVLICPEEAGDLKGRRGLRRQRRTIRSRRYRRQWFAKELAKIGLPRPSTALHDPVGLRVRAVKGELLKAEELHAALAHLFKRRGYTEVPWKNRGEGKEEGEQEKEKGEIRERMSQLGEAMKESGCEFPCELLAMRKSKGLRERKEVWPRDLLEKEFRAIVAAQGKAHPRLAEKAEWLLYGDTQEIKGHRVFFRNSEGRNPGVLGLRWPRFENRGPAVDSLQPVDEEGRPLHVVRKDKPAYVGAQWELAVMNFRVLDRTSGALVAPDAAALARLRELWENSRRRKGKSGKPKAEPKSIQIKMPLLEKWAGEFSARYKLVEGQQPLTPESGAGRARYSSPTLEKIRAELGNGLRVDPPQPVLQRAGESADAAINRYLTDIRHPLVRHRLVLFRRVLGELVKRFGKPDMIILEAVRSLALSEKRKREQMKRNKENREERSQIREELAGNRQSTSRNAILRYRLWKEARCTCPFCGEKITQEDLYSGAVDIEHLVPRALVDCNEFYNLTVGHIRCNRELKGDTTPFAAFGQNEKWAQLRDNAERCFRGRKLEIFLSPRAEELVEEKADLQHTAYIARVIRHVALLELDWLGEDGRDPTPQKQNPALRFQVTNGQLTSRLRQAWGLNQVLHPVPPGTLFYELPPEQQREMQEKNRGDLRHHALDAMVIACTLPWLAHRTHGATDEMGRHGWWTQDEKKRSQAANPIGLSYQRAKTLIERIGVRHHASRSSHQQAYATTIYGKRGPNTYVAREVFASLTPRNLESIWPRELAAYCAAAWKAYSEESPDVAGELKASKGYVPRVFIERLCFSHFQRWRAAGSGAFSWPDQVRIPMRSVQLVSVKDDSAVRRFCAGTLGYVKRTGFKEVRIHLSEDGKSLVPVFVPYWRTDHIPPEQPARLDTRPIATLRKGEVVELKRPLGAGAPAGKYRILVLGQEQVKILPPHVANTEGAKVAFGIPKSGYQPYWGEFIGALGYELPHSASGEPQPSGEAEPGTTAH